MGTFSLGEPNDDTGRNSLRRVGIHCATAESARAA